MEHFGASTEAVAKYKKMVARSDARQALLRKQELEFDPEDHDGRPNDPKVAKELYERDQAVQRLDQKDPWRERGPWVSVRNKDQTFDYVEEGTHGQNWDLIRMGMDARDQERAQQEKEMGRSNGSRGHFDAGHVRPSEAR